MTTPHGSRAGGFWNDTGVSSHTDSSAHAHKWALLTACVSHGTQNVGTLVLLPARTIYRGTAETLLSCQCAENYPSVLFEERKSGNGSPPAGGAADIPIAEARGFTPRTGKSQIYQEAARQNGAIKSDFHEYPL